MSTHDRKVRKRAGLPFVRVSPTARSHSAEEWEDVVRFGFDKPGDDLPEVWDDVEGMTFGVRLMMTALLVGLCVLVGIAIVAVVVTR